MENPNQDGFTSNPFLALFKPQSTNEHGPTPVSVSYKEQQGGGNISILAASPSAKSNALFDEVLNDMLQRVFLVTINNDSERIGRKQVHAGLPRRCVYLKDTSNDIHVNTTASAWLSWSNIDQALMERLTMVHPRNNVMVTGGATSTSLAAEVEAGELECIKYLTGCYRRSYEDSTKFRDTNPELYAIMEKAKKLAVSYAGTCLLCPDMFPNQDCHKQLFHLLVLSQDDKNLPDFLNDLLKVYTSREDLESIFPPIFFMLNENKKDITLFGAQTFQYLEMLSFFAKHSELAKLLVSSNTWLPPKKPFAGQGPPYSGRAFQTQTLLGSFLSLTSISTDLKTTSEYFHRPSEQSQDEMQATMASLRTRLDSISNKLHKFVFEMLRASPACKHELLRWLGSCLHSNGSRQQMMAELFAATLAEDGFLLNLGTMLLKLCQPFLDPSSPKLLKIDPRYCATVTSPGMLSSELTGIHSVGLEEETRLVTCNDETVKLDPDSFGFVTELFFMTHRCLQLGIWKVCEKYRKLMAELAQMQRAYQDASSQGGANNAIIGRMKVTFESGIIQQLSLKTHLLNPSMLELAMRFYVASASWLNQVALAGDDFQDMAAFKEVEMPLPAQTPAGLLFVPEFVVENMADFIIFLRHFSEETLESAGKSLNHFVTFFVIYMGSAERVQNPHLRAKLAEALEALIPVRKNQELDLEISPIAMFHRGQAFLHHKEATEHLPAALLRLFIDIEFTGHSMQFEQKFGYRHHMYTILEYIWGQQKYKESLLRLCEQKKGAETTCGEPPLVLKFINLLINDSVFLLDESLEFMAQIKKMQAQQDNEEFESLSEDQRQAHLRELQQTGQMAKSHNILARETVHTLNYLTTELRRPLLLPCMASRMASMLNYFLMQLVGPKMGSLKVKDPKEFHFKPQKLVSDIVDIYLNLGDEEVYVKAIGQDERSYSPELFVHAKRVLKLIGRPASVIFRLTELAQRIKEKKEDLSDNLPEPPEEFKDPIMDTLMRHPMILPTSGKVVDRDIICRHLLSDQKDPFNRKPLTVCDLIPDTELKAKIDRWLSEHSRHADKVNDDTENRHADEVNNDTKM